MTKYKIIILLFIAATLLLTGFKVSKKTKTVVEDKWSGTVTFHEKRTGSTLARHDWWMTATITNNVGYALDSAIIENTEGDKWRCATKDTTELELGIEEDKNEYGITVPVPGCYGYSITKYGERLDGYGLTDQTAIVINRQRLGPNHDILKGNLVLTDNSPDGSRTVTTYTWDLKKSK